MKALIIDDISDNLSLLEQCLSSKKYRCVKASNGKEALEILKKDTDFHIIISDILMPEMDGFAFLRKLKQDANLKKIPVVLYTASYTEEEDKELALSLGASLFLIKPHDDEHFLALIEEVIKANLKGELVSRDVQIKEEEEFLRLYSEALIRKLESKMLRVEKEGKKLEAVLNIVSDGFVIINSDKLITAASSSVKNIIGYEPYEITGKKCSDIFNAENEGNINICDDCPVDKYQNDQISIFSDKKGFFKCKGGGTVPCIVKFGIVRVSEKDEVNYIYSFRDLRKEESYEKALIKKSRELELLNELIKIISSSLDVKEVYDVFASKLDSIIPFERVSVTVLENNHLRVYVLSEKGKHRAVVGYELPLDGTITGEVIRSRKSVIMNDTKQEGIKDKFPLSPILSEGVRSYISIPLFFKERCIGTFNLGTTYPNAFTEETLSVLNSIASSLATAVNNTILYHRVFESEENYRLLFEDSNDVIFVLDKDLRFVNINRAGVHLTGYKKDELIGMQVYDIIDEKHVKFIADIYKDARAGKIKDEPFEVRLIRKDGFVLTVEVRAKFLIDKYEEIKIHGTARDITELKKLKQQIVQMDKMSAVGGLVAGIAHELNNPLTGVIGYSELLLTDPAISEKRREQVEKIASEAERARKIVQNLLAFAREYKPEKKAVDVNQIIEESISLREYDLRVNNVNVEKRFSKGLPITMADPHQLQQVMINLLVNSEHAILEKGAGSGHITVETSLDRKSGRIKIEVADDGVGIPQSIINRVFDPFFTTKGIGKGTGLGLSIVFGIISEHKGMIYIDEKVEKGAKIVIELPVVKVEEKHKRADERVEAAEQNIMSGMILVVDDEEIILNLMDEVLSDFGFKVDTAKSAKTAIEKAGLNNYDLIISDFKMPGMSGQDLFSGIISINPSYAGRIVFITGDILNPETQEFLKATNSYCLSKPFRIDEIRAFIRQFFER